MQIILSTIVGSRLHGTANPDSDKDLRGVHLLPLIDHLSPFRDVSSTHWLEGDTDQTSYELAYFCKLGASGNPSALEVLVGIPEIITPEGEELRGLLPKFLSKQKCYEAFLGYSGNQEKKFRQDKEGRKWKYACAHVRTLYQLLHLLRTGELRGTYPGGVTEELKAVKEGRVRESDVMSRVFELEGLCRQAYEKAPLPDAPDIEAIEAFVMKCYSLPTTSHEPDAL